MSCAVVVGTRPEIIKMASVIHELQRVNHPFFILHTGQHYDYVMDRVFFESLAIPAPDVNLAVGSGTHGAQTGRILAGAEAVFLERRPSMVLVQGDTNTVVAAALAATKLQISVGHVEAGLRSYDRSMPEELNRIVADHIATHLFPPTPRSADILLGEGLPAHRITVTGNTVADIVLSLVDRGELGDERAAALGLRPGHYALVTAHRAENVDSADSLRRLLAAVSLVCRKHGLVGFYPCHPRTLARLRTFGIELPPEIVLHDPVGLLDFLALERHAALVLTDSGGAQEESCILRVPCVTLRSSTERPESVEVGANMIAGIEPEEVLRAADHMLARPRTWVNPFGDGFAGRRIVEIVRGALGAT